MKTLDALTDPEYIKIKHSALDRFFLRMIRDERDLPFMHLTLKITLTLIPAGILLYMPFVDTWLWAVLAVIYLYLNNLRFKGPFGLMLHCTCHRALFKKKYDYLNLYIPWVLAPFFGHSPETY